MCIRDRRFHCFGCGEDGDVIDFTAKLFDLSSKEAAEKLAQDFGPVSYTHLQEGFSDGRGFVPHYLYADEYHVLLLHDGAEHRFRSLRHHLSVG